MKAAVLVLGLLLAVPLAFFVALNLLSSDETTDCAKVRDPKAGAWQAADFDARNRIVSDLSLCERLQGRSRERVKALLGPPTEEKANALIYELPAGGAGAQNSWTLYFGADGRVSDTRYDVPTPPL